MPRRFRSGASLHKQLDLEAAEAAYIRALRLRPTMADAASSLGSLYQSQGKLDLAVRQYQHALQVSPNFADSYYNWGTVLKQQDRAGEAADMYRRALRSNPAMVNAHYNLGTVLQGLGQFEAAAASYEEAIRLRPDFVKAHNNLGIVNKLQGKVSEAIACYSKALESAPTTSKPTTILARSCNSKDATTKRSRVIETSSARGLISRRLRQFGTAWQEWAIRPRPWLATVRAFACVGGSSRSAPQPFARLPEPGEIRRGLAGVRLAAASARVIRAATLITAVGRCAARRPHAAGACRARFRRHAAICPLFERGRKRGGNVILEVQPRLMPLCTASGFDEADCRGHAVAAVRSACAVAELAGNFWHDA